MATITVTDLMLNFAEACRALVPTLNRAGVPWHDGQQYDNWDRVAEALFETLVTEPCAFQAIGEAGSGRPRTPRYGFASDTNQNAWLTIQGDLPARVIALSTITTPFSHVQCEKPIGSVPLEGSRFAFVYELGDGPQSLESVDLAAE